MKKLKQTLGKEESNKNKNLNLSSTMIASKKTKNLDPNSFFLYVSIKLCVEISK
jgi:hypothetical protein